MSTEHIKKLVATVKTGERPSGWLADMAVMELGAIQDALRVVLTERGAHATSEEYGKAKALLEQVARDDEPPNNRRRKT